MAIQESSQVSFITGQEITRSLPVPHPISQNTANSLEELATIPNLSTRPGLQMCSSHNAFLGSASELLLAFCCFSRLNPLEIGFSLKRSLFWLRIQSMWNKQVRYSLGLWIKNSLSMMQRFLFCFYFW